MPCNQTENGLINEPFRMQDARAFTDYRSASELDREVRHVLDKNKCGAKSSLDYKYCLIRNADILITYFNKKIFEKNGVYKCN